MDSFKPLRRKVGMATLLIACMFVAGWVRSLSMTDSVRFVYNNVWYQLISHHGAIECRSTTWAIYQPAHPSAFVSFPNWQFSLTSTDNKSADMPLLFDIPSKQRWQVFGLARGLANHEPPVQVPNNAYAARTNVWAVHYWSIVIPLTLLSAWLLLSKPRIAKPPVNDDVPS